MKKYISCIILIAMLISVVASAIPWHLISFAAETENPELIFHEGFEKGLVDWTEANSISKGKFSVMGNIKSEGLFSVRVKDDVTEDAIALRSVKFSLEPNAVYTLHSDFYCLYGSSVVIYVRTFDKNGKKINAFSVSCSYRTWTPASLTFTTPANTVSGDVYLYGASSTVGEAHIDNINIYKGEPTYTPDYSNSTKENLRKITINTQVIYDMPKHRPTISHPRVYFNKDDIETIKANASHPQNKGAFKRLQTEIADTQSGKLPSTTGDNLDDKLMGIIQAKAFYYAVWGDETKGREAVSMLNNFLDTANPVGSEYNSQGYLVFTIGAVYDWCYPLLTEDDKRYFQNMGIITASTMECGYPPSSGSVLNGHSAEAMILRDQMAFAIAVHDEKPDIYQNVAGRYFKESVESIKYLAQAKSSMFGNSYSTYRYQWEALSLFMMDAIGLPNIYGENHKELLYWNLYARRPDSSEIHDGDSVSNNQSPWYYDERGTKSFFMAGNYYKDPYLKGEVLRQNNGMIIETNTGNQGLSSVEVLCFNDPSVEYQTVRDLPLSRYYPSPRGEMIARTSWAEGADSPAVIAQMKVDEYWTQGHDHLDSGEFEIYYKGALANDTGYYQAGRDGSNKENSGNTVYGTVHFYNYHRRTIAHNCMLVFDPDEDVIKSYKGYSNDGGQIYANNEAGLTNSSQITEANHVANVLGREFGPDLNQPEYTYLKGDLAKAYGEKVPEYERSFMFLNLKNDETPAAMIVFDRIKAKNKTYDKKWVLHGLFKPEINGSRTVFKDTRDGYNGKLTVDTLLPKADNMTVTTVGKEDWEYTGTDNKKYIGQSFMVNGTDYWAQALKGKLNEGGGYRIEISPKEDAEEDYFLNVLQVADADSQNEPLASEMIDSETHIGVKIADRVVMFAKGKNRVENNVAFNVSGNDTYKFTIADLKEGTWQVNKDGMELCKIVSDINGGVGSFEAMAGDYTLTYLGEYGNKKFTKEKMPETEGLNVKLPKENKYVYTGTESYTKNDITFVDAKALYKSLGSSVNWDKDEKILTVTKNDTTVKLTSGSDTAYVNDAPVKLVSAPEMKEESLMAPFDFVTFTSGYVTNWDTLSNSAVLKEKATIVYNEEQGKILVTTVNPAILYITTSDENGKITNVKKYSINSAKNRGFGFKKGQKAYMWDSSMVPMCEPFSID